MKNDSWRFATMPEDDRVRVDIRNINGIEMQGTGTLDKTAKTASLEFVRPFDVSHDEALTLEGG